MKRIVFLVAILFSVSLISSADEQRKVKLNDDHQKEMIRFAFCNIFVEKGVSTDDYANVSVTIENTDETNVILVFGHSFPEKDLKSLNPSIVYDKYFPGTKGGRVIDTYQGARKVFYIQPSDKIFIQESQIKSGEENTQKHRLPLYIAKYKNKSRKKLLLLEKQVVELEIEYEVKNDLNIIRLNEACDSLLEDLGQVKFCPNRKHRPQWEKQVEPYKERIEKIKAEADSIIQINRWYTTDKEYQPYKELLERVDSIDLTQYKQDCGKHVRPVYRHNCKYCNLTLQQIYNKLDDYYIKIYNSSNRQEVKSSLMSEVNLLYRCCTDGNCSKHSSLWRNSEYRSKIIDRYNRICNF